jgi:hypothetical protein
MESVDFRLLERMSLLPFGALTESGRKLLYSRQTTVTNVKELPAPAT